MKTLYFDCSCGASGDMILGALIDAGVDFEKLRAALESLGVPGFSLTAEKVDKHGIMATQFRVHTDHGHEHAHRHLGDILGIIGASALPDAVKEAAALTFRHLAGCEAAIHGSSIDEVHFHEVGAVDSIVDILGAHWALHELGVERIVASALNLGSGVVKTAHGVLPVPAPATVALLEGVPAYGSDVAAELVTPTGAALIAQCASNFGSMPAMRVGAVGYGSGSRDLPDRANVLRAILGEIEDAPPTESVVVIEANIDDMNPEMFPVLLADVIEKGARDAFLTPILGKKGRPAHLVTILCDAHREEDIVRTIFHGSTTLGVRMRTERRVCLEREWRTVATPWGEVRVKVGRYRGGITCLSPEFEDCRRVAEERQVSTLAVYEAAHAAAITGMMFKEEE